MSDPYGYNPPVTQTPATVNMPCQIGTLAGVPVVVNIDGGAMDPPEATTVTLLADYVLSRPPGFPTRPGWLGTATTQPQMLAAGSTLTTWPVEAAALITLGAAELA